MTTDGVRQQHGQTETSAAAKGQQTPSRGPRPYNDFGNKNNDDTNDSLLGVILFFVNPAKVDPCDVY